MPTKTKKRKLKRLFIISPFVIAFILIANLCDLGVMPVWIQTPIDAVNAATGGMIYQKTSSSIGLSVHFIDVGQGDSILICCNGKNMLIDGGIATEAPTVENYLNTQDVKSLDYVVATNTNQNHIGGLVSVIRDVNVGKILMSGEQGTTQTFYNLQDVIEQKNIVITTVKAGNSYNLGEAKFTILAPIRDYKNTNEMSLVIRLRYKSSSFLFTSDASQNSEADMLSENQDLSADVLKVGDYGSSAATTPEFLKAVHPRYAVISVGAGNKSGFPNNSVTQELNKFGVITLRTDINGTIVFYSNGNEITYKVENSTG